MATFVGENVEQNQNTQDFWNCALSKPVTCTLAVFPSWDQTGTRVEVEGLTS